MLHIHEQQQEALDALKRIIKKKVKGSGAIPHEERAKLYFLGGEFGFCRDTVNMILGELEMI